MNMPDFNDIKGKVMSAIGNAADVTKDAATKTATKAKTTAKLAKLNVDIGSQKETIKKCYIEIGKLFYEEKKNDPDGVYAQLFDEVSLAMNNIDDFEAQISQIKSSGDNGQDSGIEVEFEEVVSEVEDAVSDAASEVADVASEVADAASEVADAAEEACDCGCEEHSKDDKAE